MKTSRDIPLPPPTPSPLNKFIRKKRKGRGTISKKYQIQGKTLLLK